MDSPRPPGTGEAKGRCDEDNETQSQGNLQGAGGLGAVKGKKTLAKLAEHFQVHPTQITDWNQQLLARAEDAACQDWVTYLGE